MAYAVKYLFKFQSSNGIVREIRVLQDGYSGSVIQRPLGRAPVIKKEQNGGVHGTSLTFYAECHIDREYIEFYTSDPKEYRVDVYAGSTLLWQGYITPELYSEPDIAPPYDVQVVATDGVGELKLYDFTPQGTVTLRSLLTYLLGHTGLSTDVNLVSSLKPGSHGAGALLDMQICVDYLAGKTCYEALTYILDTLHATITRWGGAWLLVRETNVTFTNDKVRYFNTSGNSALLSGSVQTLGAMHSAPAWPVGQLSTVIDPAKNKVVVQAPWHPVTCLANPDMASDTGWTKSNNASYGPDGYLLPNNDTGGSTYATAHISQALSLTGMRTPLSFELRATGVAAQVGVRVGAVIGVLLTYTVGSTVYLLRKGDEGTPVWKQGSAPGSSIDGSLVDYQQPLASFDADRIQAETLRIDEIPAFVQGTSYPSGTLTVYVVGSCARVYGAHLDVVLPKGYQDILRIDNGARGEGDSVEIAIGRQTADVAYYQAFLQGLLLDSGSLITGFSDANFTTAMDYLALISRDYALSAALPRALAKGTVYLESSIGMPPLVFAKGGLNYWLETWSWDLYEDELEIDARTLPSASLTVQSETILESDGSTVSSSSSGSSGGGSSISPGGGTNYFQIDEDLQTLLEPKPQFDFLSPKKGLIFGTTEETDVASSPAHLMLRNLGTAQSPNYALYTPFALITGGDQIVGSGTPGGGGGGGASYLYQLKDTISSWTDKPSVSATQVLVFDPQAQDKESNTGAWKYVPATDIGRVYSGGTGITINPNTNEISVTANTYAPYNSAGYLPLTAGSSYPLSGALIISTGNDAKVILDNTDADTNYQYISFRQNGTEYGRLGTFGTTDLRWGGSNIIYHSGNFNPGNYLPLTGGTVGTSAAQTAFPLILNASGMGNAGYLRFMNDSTTIGHLGFGAIDTPVFRTAAGTNYNLLHANNYSSYALPLTGGTLTKDDTPLNLKGGSDSTRLAFYTSDGTFKSYVMYGWSRMYMTYGQRQIGLNASNAYYSDDNGTTQYVVYHSGNLSPFSQTILASNYNFDANSLTSARVHYTTTGDIGTAATGWSNFPTSSAPAGSFGLITINEGSYPIQLFHSYNLGQIWWRDTRYASGVTWNSWRKIWDSLNSGTTSYPWSASSLTLAGSISGATSISASGNISTSAQLRVYTNSSSTYGYIKEVDRSANTARLILGSCWGYNSEVDAVTIENGKVGIGKIPEYSFDVAGTGCFRAPSGENSLVLAKTSNYYPNIVFSGQNYNASIEGGDNLVFYTAGSARFRVFSDGKVAVGASAPDYKFDVQGGISRFVCNALSTYSLSTLGTAGAFIISAGNNSYAPYGFGLCIWNNASGTAQLQSGYTNGTNTALNMALQPLGGNVGIGTASPYSKVEINGTYAAPDTTSIVSTSMFTIGQHQNDSLCFGVYTSANSNAGWIQTAYYGTSSLPSSSYARNLILNPIGGNVGIGTNSPSARLDVAGSTTTTLLQLTGTTAAGTNTYNYVRFGSDAGIELLWGSNFKSPAGDLHFTYTNGMSFGGGWNAPHVRIGSTGTVAIGTSALQNAIVLRRASDGADAYTFGSLGTSGTSGATLKIANMGGTTTYITLDNAGKMYVYGSITSSGDQVISSDERLKTIVKPVDMTVEQLAGMRAVIYDRKDSGVRSLGVIAQDWEKVLPESVNQGEYLTFKYAQTAMVSAIVLAKHETEQDKEIKKLREKVQKLEMDNLRLKARLGLEN